MKNDIRELKKSEISSDVFVISPTQIDWIAENFGNAVATAMNVRPLADKICHIARESLIETLESAKHSGE